MTNLTSRIRNAALLVLILCGHMEAEPMATKDLVRLSKFFLLQGPELGSAAPDFLLERLTGGQVQASKLWADLPLMIITGSYSCPRFRDTTADRIALLKQFKSKFNIVVIYTVEAHPLGSVCPYADGEVVTPDNIEANILIAQPSLYQDRVDLAKLCQKTLKMESIVAVDKMDNNIWKAYGSAPNCAYLIDVHGKVICRQGFFEPKEMATALATLLAPAVTK